MAVLLPLVWSSAFAGQNAGGFVYLSWDSSGYVQDRTGWNSGASSLYLHVGGVSQVASLYAHLKWSQSSPGQCYGIAAAPCTNPCGSAFATDSLVVFGSDSTVYDGMLPLSRTTQFSIEYRVTAGQCDSAPGRLLVVNAIAIDDLGAQDTLAVQGDATINGGADIGTSLANVELSTPRMIAGTAQNLTVAGPRVVSGTNVSLLAGHTVLTPTRSTLDGAHHCVTATFNLADATPGVARVLLSSDETAQVDTAGFGVEVWQPEYRSNVVGLRIETRVADVNDDWTPLADVTFADSTVRTALSAAGIVSLRRISPVPWDSMIVRTLADGTQLLLPRATRFFFDGLLPDTNVCSAVASLTHPDVGAYLSWLPAPQYDPSDDLYPQQWYLHNTGQFAAGPDINARAFWDIPPCGICYPTKVGVLDTGIDGTHPEFAGRLIDGAGKDGYSALTDVDGHGTSVAGIIGAAWNNGGIAGIYKDAILASVVYDRYGHDDQQMGNLSAGLGWFMYRYYTLVNCSAAQQAVSSPELDAAVRDAYVSGITLVSSTGNENSSGVSFPAAEQGALAVGAAYADGLRWNDYYVDWGGGTPPGTMGGSNYGVKVSVVAPGGRFITTTAPGGYNTVNRPSSQYGFGGTSAAAPMVTGILAKLMEKWQLMSPDDSREVLQRTATDVVGRDAVNLYPNADPPLNKLDLATGYGLVNAAAAFEFIDAGNFRDVHATQANIVSTSPQWLYNPTARTDCSGHVQLSGNQQATRYRMRATLPLTPYAWQEAYTSPPAVWAVNSCSNGAGVITSIPPNDSYYPETDVVQVTADSVVMETNLYRDAATGAWWPVCPSQLVMSASAYARSLYYTGVAPVAPNGRLTVRAHWTHGRVEFTIAGVSGTCELSIYDVMGRRMTRSRGLVNGNTVMRWYGASEVGRVAPGIYFARVTAAGQTAACKVVYLR